MDLKFISVQFFTFDKFHKFLTNSVQQPSERVNLDRMWKYNLFCLSFLKTDLTVCLFASSTTNDSFLPGCTDAPTSLPTQTILFRLVEGYVVKTCYIFLVVNTFYEKTKTNKVPRCSPLPRLFPITPLFPSVCVVCLPWLGFMPSSTHLS